MRLVVHRRSVPALLIGAVLAFPPVFVLTATPVLADCGSDGLTWPERPADVRGGAFIGTALQLVRDVPEAGMRSVRFGVDTVLDGAVGPVVDVTPWCVGTRFVAGQRYLVATTDTLPLPGSTAASPTPGDGHWWFTDPTAVAWRVRDDGSVRLLDHGETTPPAPAWLRAPSTLGEAMDAILPRGGDPDPFHPSPTPVPDDPPGVTHERLGMGWLDDRFDDRIESWRSSLEPGAMMPATRFTGDWLMTLEAGGLVVTLIEGRAAIVDADGPRGFREGPPATEMIAPGETLQVGPDAVLAWENRGTAAATVWSSAVIPGGDDAMVRVDPDAAPVDPFVGPVIERRVLSGPGQTGDRYRITIADRSGRVLGARVPTERDLRFAHAGDPPVGNRDIGLGPVAFLPGNVRELLVWWMGTPCGPIATVDVAQDLSAIRVVDRTGGCDAAGMGYAVVLRIRGDVPAPRDIRGSWVKR
jgi:hypothetical protein